MSLSLTWWNPLTLGHQEYYEEKPVLDFYTRVVADVLAELANPTPVKKHLDGDDADLSKGGKNKSGKKIDKKKFKKQIKALAKDVVRLERELMRAGAEP